MKGGLCCKTASCSLIMLTFCLLRSFSFIEARDLRTEVIGPQGVGPVTSPPENKPYEDTIHKDEVDGLKLYPMAENYVESPRESPPENVDGDIIGRSMNENVMAVDDVMDHSPGIGHGQPPPSP